MVVCPGSAGTTGWKVVAGFAGGIDFLFSFFFGFFLSLHRLSRSPMKFFL
jgi:hypothetical protein